MNAQSAFPSWSDGPAKSAVLEFIHSVTTPGASFVPPCERIAAFDNDGTLWCEKPLYVQADFLFRRFVAMVREDPQRAQEQPYKAVVEDDREWLKDIYAHVPELVKGVTEAYAGMTTDAFDAAVCEFFASAVHPILGVPYTQAAYRPMLELMELLKAHDFKVYICSAGGRDFVRAVCEQVYDLPRDRVIGSATTLEYRDGDSVSNGRRGAAYRRRTWEGRPHLDAHRAEAPARRRERRRGHTDAGIGPLRASGPSRRRRARVRLRRERREGARRGRNPRLDRGQHEGGLQDGVLIRRPA